VSALKFGNLLWKGRNAYRVWQKSTAKHDCHCHRKSEKRSCYPRHGRPHKVSDYIFITTTAPVRPNFSSVVGRAVVRAVRRTGISAPTQGAHLLRHSAATCMLREGVYLPAIGALFRHVSIQTTTVYAKVDLGLLQEVAMPWPEVQPC
jgi:integrase/recombinase XerD